MTSFQLRIKHRLALLVALLLSLDVMLLSGVTWLISKTEQEVQKSQRSKDISAKTGLYFNAVYGTIHALNGFGSYSDKRVWTLSLQNAENNLEEKYNSLLNACSEDKEATADLLKLKAHFKKTSELYAGLFGEPDAVRERRRNDPTFQMKVDSFISELARFNERQSQIETASNSAQQKLREEIKNLLVLGISFNIAAALFLAIQLDRTILHRIDQLIDNTKRMRHKLPLNAALTGADEIQELDAAFHEMSQALNKEQELLSASEARIRAFIAGVPIGLMSLDEHGKIEIVNLPLENMFGVEANSMLGKDIASYFVTGELGTEAFWMQLQKTAVGHAVEVIAKTREGKEFAAELTLSAERGEKKSYLASVANIQEKHELTKLRQAVLAMVSHELRTPLTSILGFLELIRLGKYGDINPDLAKQAAGAHESTSRLIGLVNDLLDLEKLESESYRINKVPCELNTILNQSLNAVSMIASTRGIEIIVTPQPCRLEVMGDPSRLVQVLVNLLANAVKFSADQGEVVVTWSQEKSLLKIAVADTGPGVAPEYQKLIFERFQQVSQPGMNHPGGTGLGLPICKSIVEQHGGTIGVESVVNKGSTFWFTLPCDEEDD